MCEEIIVLGAGVIGLTTATLLQESGYATKLISKDSILDTHSLKSGAIWGPFLSDNDDRVLNWSFDTWRILKDLSTNPESGVKVVKGICAAKFITSIPDWVLKINPLAEVITNNLPAGYLMAWEYSSPIIDMEMYIPYLYKRYIKAGGVLEIREISDINEVSSETTKNIINCTGIYAKDLVGDEELTGSKGQLAVLQNPGISSFFAERGNGPELLYILPQGNKIIVGGTAEWNYKNNLPLEDATSRIIDRAHNVDNRISHSSVIGFRSGIRPCRTTIRIEADKDDKKLIHNYGHCGSGVSLSWASAMEALTIIKEQSKI